MKSKPQSVLGAPKYANHHGYSDVNPYEVVRVVSEKCLVIRAMKAERDPTWKPDFHVGGFCGHVSNQNEQRWIITSNEEAPEQRIRLGKKGWRSPHGERFILAHEPVKFYDYNF